MVVGFCGLKGEGGKDNKKAKTIRQEGLKYKTPLILMLPYFPDMNIYHYSNVYSRMETW